DLDPTVKISVSRLFDVIKTEALKNQQSFDLYQANRDRTTSKSLAKAYRPNIDKIDRNLCEQNVEMTNLQYERILMLQLKDAYIAKVNIGLMNAQQQQKNRKERIVAHS
ncbi:hypothetical protein PHPALM_31142, partial [Phytophthora palmivora]